MPRGKPDGAARLRYFRALRGNVLDAWTSPQGFAYDAVLYAVGYPYRKGDVGLVLGFAGKPGDAEALPPLPRLNRTLVESSYPDLAEGAPEGVSAEGWSAVLHFLDPSYPLATLEAVAALRALGAKLPPAPTLASYPAYVAAVDALKEQAPMWAVPETNWYLARVLEVGLKAFAPPKAGEARLTPPGGSRAVRRARRTGSAGPRKKSAR